ncbi:chemotaxis protein [Pseudoalteromonas sp. NBT06-2]|uniref:chemotaxis protein n=1 Tax=Pseudoalteromonas sp. NBT06-2 TaxID=2025950 RepID=UPI000BA4F65A|nr:chemotaxis protein [Pseudoalteromonas sp. NBT06-2]PAJ73772.1 chemotaxis protein [Pseudoalteromonas sp. NBT06-2]
MTVHIENDQEIGCFIIVATVVAQLDIILVEAKNLSLAAKNARVVAIRAGEAALGFKSITNFIDEFSTKTIQTTQEINQHSNLLFKLALEQLRASQFEHHINRAYSLNDKSHIEIKKIKNDATQIFRESLTRFNSEMQALTLQFEEIRQQMRAAEYIAVTSRVEASQAGEYCDSLESVSDYIASAALRIKSAISINLSTLSQLKRIKVSG